MHPACHRGLARVLPEQGRINDHDGWLDHTPPPVVVQRPLHGRRENSRCFYDDDFEEVFLEELAQVPKSGRGLPELFHGDFLDCPLPLHGHARREVVLMHVGFIMRMG